jgi:lipoprotein-releasing system permease protein
MAGARTVGEGPVSRPFGAWERKLAARYLRAQREDGGVALISIISFTAIFLAVAVLIIVMSVMNGFRAELLSRILGVKGHVFVGVSDLPLADASRLVATIKARPEVKAVTPLIEGQVMVVGGPNATARGALVTGIARADLSSLPLVVENVVGGSLASWGQGPDGGDEIAMGSRLAEALGVLPGDAVQLISPNGAVTPFGTTPRSKDYVVSAIFNVGMSEYDQTLIYMPLEQAQLFFNREGRADLLDVRVADPDRASDTVLGVQELDPARIVTDWRQASEGLAGALQIERNVMRLILSLIVAIAALNIISGLVMLVKNKTRDIAVLRTMGATRGSILRVFMMAGASVGVLATAAGVAGGTLFCLNIKTIQAGVEALFGPVFDASVYFLSNVPAKVEMGEVVTTALFAAFMSVLVTLPPAWRAARLDPVEALRYE